MTSIHGAKAKRSVTRYRRSYAILAVTGCQKPVPQAPDTRAGDETAIRPQLTSSKSHSRLRRGETGELLR
jgi:hypothetical protein